jgi:hypothetical protein
MSVLNNLREYQLEQLQSLARRLSQSRGTKHTDRGTVEVNQRLLNELSALAYLIDDLSKKSPQLDRLTQALLEKLMEDDCA